MFAARLASELRRRGIDAEAIDGNSALMGLPDADVLERTRHGRRAVVTENARHFRPLAAAAIASGPGHQGLIVVHRGRHTIGSLVEVLADVAAAHPGDDDLRDRELSL